MAETKPEKKIVKRRAFDLSEMKSVSLEGTIELSTVPPTTIEGALELAQGDLQKLLSWVQAGYSDETVKSFRKTITSPDPNVVLAPGAVKKFAANFFVYSEVAKCKTRKEKYAAAFALLRSNPVLLETVKTLAALNAEAEAEAESEETEEEETEG